jgi:hypothetical protein
MFLGKLNGLHVDAANVAMLTLRPTPNTSLPVPTLEIVKDACSSLSKLSMDFQPVELDGMNYLLIALRTWISALARQILMLG